MSEFTPQTRKELKALLRDLAAVEFSEKFRPVVESILRSALHYEAEVARRKTQSRSAASAYLERDKAKAKKLGVSLFRLRLMRQADKLGITVEELQRRQRDARKLALSGKI